jgi:hypothetical protein
MLYLRVLIVARVLSPRKAFAWLGELSETEAFGKQFSGKIKQHLTSLPTNLGAVEKKKHIGAFVLYDA